jgi:cell division ATPase FtsA
LAKLLLQDPELVTEKGYQKKKFIDIINLRYNDFASIINDTLAQAGWQGLLPAGVIVVSTTAQLPGLDEILRTQTKLPIKSWQGEAFASPGRRRGREIGGIGAYSLACVYAKQSTIFFPKSRIIKSVIRDQINTIKSWFQGLLPE